VKNAFFETQCISTVSQKVYLLKTYNLSVNKHEHRLTSL